MEETLTAWLLPALALLAGIAIGFLVARLAPSAAPNRTQRQLDDIQEQFNSYQSEVVSHFHTSANLMRKLSQDYQEVQQHLTEGASRLTLDEQTRQRLLASLDNDGPTAPRGRLSQSQSNEAPRDYAPKSTDTPGTLDATFGLNKTKPQR
ncbi:MAG: YhcB family protein [Pseudomonas sp.]